MNTDLIIQYINGLDKMLFSIVLENEQDFIDKFIRAKGDDRSYRLIELAVNSSDLLYACEVYSNLNGNVLNDAISTKAVAEWVSEKLKEEESVDHEETSPNNVA